MEVLSIVSFIVGFFLALQLAFPVTMEFFGDSDYVNLISIAVFIALMVIVSILIRMLANILKKIVHMSFLGFVDNIGGAVLGVLKVTLLISVLLWVVDSTQFYTMQPDDSIFYPYIFGVAPNIFSWLGQFLPFIESLIDTMEHMPKQKDSYLTMSWAGLNL